MKILVGYRRLYEAVGCSLPTEGPIFEQFLLNAGFEGMIYVGSKPHFGIYLHSADGRFIIPGKQESMGAFEFHQDTEQLKYGGCLFFEAAVLQLREADESTCEEAIKKGGKAIDHLLDFAESDERRFLNLLSAITGIAGLRIHRQLVMKQINENAVVVVGGKSFSRHHSGTFEVLESLAINQTGKVELKRILAALCESEVASLERTGAVLAWLERAWTHLDPIAKFIACFVPIECILGSISVRTPKAEKKALVKIKKLINGCAEEDKDLLSEVFEKYRHPRPPSLEDRFEAFAMEANFPNAKADIAAFKRFNKMRNALHHRGDASANLIINVDAEIVGSLEDIAERYVNYAIFRDQRVYQSVWRPKTA